MLKARAGVQEKLCYLIINFFFQLNTGLSADNIQLTAPLSSPGHVKQQFAYEGCSEF